MLDLVCIDVDGTLVGASGTVHPTVWPAAARLRAAGVRLAVCSGRPAFGVARGFAERLDAEGWHVFQNGASVVHLRTGESRSAPLPADAVPALIAHARVTGWALELYTDDDYVIESTDERAERHAALLGVPFAPRPFDTVAGRVVRAQWMVPLAEVPRVLASAPAGLTLTPSTSPVMPDTGFVSVMAPDVDKAHAVRAVAAAYGTTPDRVMMVGDGSNDAAAMRAVGLPVAMGNAEPEARAAARVEVADADEGGLAQALALALDVRTTGAAA